LTKEKLFSYVSYAAVVVFAILFLYFGNMIASQNMAVDFGDAGDVAVRARVVRVLDMLEYDEDFWGQTTVLFEAELLSGDERGSVVRAWQNIVAHFSDLEKIVEEGDRILLWHFVDEWNYTDEWHFADYVRINHIIFLGIAFLVLLLIFGRVKGLNTILSLGFTCVAIFAVFIPSILSGLNIHLSAVIVCVFTVVITLFLLNGINRKSIAAVVGCLGGVLAAGLLTVLMDNVLNLTGITEGDTMQLLFLPTESPIDLNGLIFAGILIGAVGAIMDVAVSISSALSELKSNAEDMTFYELYKSGVTIGKDIIGSMTNTLVLAYIGSSLTVILLLVVYSSSLTELFNREHVIVELMQSIIGSMGVILAMPLTALVAAALFTGGEKTGLKEIHHGKEQTTDNKGGAISHE